MYRNAADFSLLILLFFFFAAPHGIWDLSSPTICPQEEPQWPPVSGRLSNLKISRWVSPRLLSNYHLSAGTWEYVRVCRCPLGVCFLQPSSSLLQSPWVGESHPALDASLLGENPCSCGSLSICELPTQGFGCCLYLISAPPTHLMVISSLYLKNLFC